MTCPHGGPAGGLGRVIGGGQERDRAQRSAAAMRAITARALHPASAGDVVITSRGAGKAGLLTAGHRREVSSATMSAAFCDRRASATLCPAHIESASMSPVVPTIGGAGS